MVIGRLHDINQGEIKFEWEIRKFFQLSNQIGTEYVSPEFSFCGVPWEIWIRPNGDIGSRSVGWIELYLAPTSVIEPILVNYSFSLKTVYGTTDTYTEGIGLFEEENFLNGWFRLIRRKRLHREKALLLSSGNLTVICTLKKRDMHEFMNSVERALDRNGTNFPETEEVIETATVDEFTQTEEESGTATVDEFTQTEEESGTATVNEFTQTEEESGSATIIDDFTQEKDGIEFTKDPSEYKVLRDFKELYLKQTDCDVVIRVKGREFPAHQAFLKARSPVLCSTFQTDMKERATGVVEIEDCDPSSFSDFLCFLYCGEVEILSAENVFSLFTIADKYDVMDLRSLCLKFIKENLSVDTFCDTISLALLHSEAELIELSNKFFAKNAANIIVTVKWQLFIVENPTVGNELFIKVLTLSKNSDV